MNGIGIVTFCDLSAQEFFLGGFIYCYFFKAISPLNICWKSGENFIFNIVLKRL